MSDSRVPRTQDDRVLDEIQSLLAGHRAGTYGDKDPGVPAMEPRHVHAAFRRWRRGGLPASSMPEPIRGGSGAPTVVTQRTDEKGQPRGPITVADPVDALIEKDRRAYSSLLLTALGQLRMARTIENRWRLEAPALEPDDPRPICADCAENPAENDRTVCSRCRKHTQRTGLPYNRIRGDLRKEAS